MSRLLVFLLLLSTSFVSTAHAQGRGRQQMNFTSVEVRVRLTYTNINAAPRDLSVQLTDPYGIPVSMHEMKSNSNGEVLFRNVPPGGYRLLIKGAPIDDTQGPTFEVLGYSNLHQETLQLTAKRMPESLMGTSPVSAASLKVPKKAHEELEKGFAALSAGKWDDAKARFEKALEIYPEASEAYNGLGVVHMQEGKKDAGREAFQKAIQLDQDAPRPYINLARIQDQDRNFPEVDRLLTKYVTLTTPSAEALLMLSKAQAATGKLDQALANARKVHAIPHKEQAHAHLLAARILSRRNQPTLATEEYTHFVNEAPNDANVQEAKRMIQTLRSSTPARPN
jgi:Tfp pilus assembly protein PilF